VKVWSGPLFDGHVCSLGYEVLDWLHAYCCHGPGDVQGEPLDLDDEMRDHVIECYRLDPATGRRMYDEVVLSRPKGRAKSEIAGLVGVAEGFGPVRFDGWDADGQPVGRRVRSPLIKCLATEESQAGNTFENIAFIAGEWGPDEHPEIFAGVSGIRRYQSASAVYLPGGGEIRACTAGAASKDGGKETHVVPDETHLYVLRELKSMYSTVARNLGKRKLAEPWMHQTTTAYRPGEQSVAEETLTAWRKGELSGRVFVNHREAKGRVDLDDEEHTKAQLVRVYGSSAPWQDIDRKYRDMRDPRICPDVATAARYFLNRSMASQDAWIAVDVVDRQSVRADPVPGDERPRPERLVAPGEAIAVGFDGSLNEDTTVLRGCRMSDGFLFRLGAWPKPDGPAGIGWEVPRLEVLAAIRETFDRYDVVRCYCDPHEWRSDVDQLAEEFGDRVVAWETRRDVAMAAALDRLHTGLVTGEIWHDGDALAREHYGNAYVRTKGPHRLVRKEYPNSPRKIDSVVGDALACEARSDALAAGWGKPEASKISRVMYGFN
jgi:phage terminase large subunit-like protein